MKLRPLHTIFLPLLLLFAGCLLHAAAPRVSSADKLKSRHFTMEAAEREAAGDNAEAYELYKRAYDTDPTNLAAGLNVGRARLLLVDDGDTIAANRALSLIRAYVDAYPADANEATDYAYISSLVGHNREALRVLSRLYDEFPQKTELLPVMAGYYAQIDEADSALAYYDRFERAEGFNEAVTVRKTILHLWRGDTIAALREAGTGIRENPAAADGYLLKAQVVEYLDQPDSVKYYLHLAESIAPDNGNVKLALADYYSETGDSAAYEEKIYEALMAEDVDVEQKIDILTHVVLKEIGGDKGTQRTDTLFSALSTQYPYEPKIQEFGAKYAYAKGDYDQALERVSLAIDMDPTSYENHLRRLTYLLAGSKYAQAVSTFESMPEEMASKPSILYLGAVAYRADSLPRKATETAGRYITTVAGMELPDSVPNIVLNAMTAEQLEEISSGYSLIGDTYAGEKDLPNAFAYYERSLRFNPLNASTLNNYAYFLAENKGDMKRASDMAQRAVSLEPKNATYLDTYAWTLFRLGDYKDALEQQRMALELMDSDTESGEFYEHMGDILFMTGDPAGALEMWKKALKLDPSSILLQKKIKHETYFYE